MDQYPQQTPPNFPPPASPIPPNAYPPPGYPTQPGYPPQAGYPAQPNAYPQAGLPAYPGQSQPGYFPAQQPPRTNRMGMWIAIIVVALLVGGGTFAYFIIQGQNTPTATLQRFCDGYKNLNAQEVYDTLSTHLQSQTNDSEADIQRSFDETKSTGAKISDCTVSNVQQNGSTATATITITATFQGITHSAPAPVKLVQENGQWKIDQLG